MRTKLLAAAALIVGLAGPALADDMSATMTPPADSMSASDLIGVAVVNQQNEKIGTLDDLLIEKENQVALAVISVGGFLGVGDKLVAIPYQDLRIVAEPLVAKTAGAFADHLRDLRLELTRKSFAIERDDVVGLVEFRSEGFGFFPRTHCVRRVLDFGFGFRETRQIGHGLLVERDACFPEKRRGEKS